MSFDRVEAAQMSHTNLDAEELEAIQDQLLRYAHETLTAGVVPTWTRASRSMCIHGTLCNQILVRV
jgi:hypothetical protein